MGVGCRRRTTEGIPPPTTRNCEWFRVGEEEHVYPIAPVVDGNTAENADVPNTFSEANVGNSFSLHNLIELSEDEDILLSMDDINELFLEVSSHIPSDVSTNYQPIVTGSQSFSAIVVSPYDVVPGTIPTDLVESASPIQGVCVCVCVCVRPPPRKKQRVF